MSTCKTCKGTGVIIVAGKQEPCPETNCLAGNLARIFQKKPKK